MPTNIAGLVTAEYTSVVNVPADGDYANEAALTDMMTAALNRTEFVRQNVPILATSVARVVAVEEAFLSAFWNNSSQVLHADTNWKTASSGSPVVTGRTATADQPGGFNVSMATSGASFALYKGSGATSAPFRTQNFDRFSAIVRIPTTVSDKQCRIGLSQDANALLGGTHGLAFVKEDAEANWQIYSKTAGGTDQVDSGVLIEADTDYLFELVRASSGTWSVRINEVEITTLTSPGNNVLTTQTFNVGAYFLCGTAATRDFELIQLGARTNTLGDRYSA